MAAGLDGANRPASYNASGDPGIPEGYEHRKRRHYPWWVKEVEKPTIEVDWDRLEPFDVKDSTALWARHLHREDFEEWVQDKKMVGLGKHVGREGLIDIWQKKHTAYEKSIHNDQPGGSLRDLSLQEGAQSIFYGLSIDEQELTPRTPFINMSERFNVRWEGSPHEASAMVEAAARHYGYAQVRYTYLERRILYKHAQHQFAPEMKYVIVPAVTWPMESAKRLDTKLGYAGIQMARVRNTFAKWALQNFIRCLGWQCEEAGMSGPSPAFAAMAGLGEMSRTNRLISPVFGGALYYSILVTDLPLAIDKPIDFGLMEFCKRCKICAEACPVGAISKETEPSWKTEGAWNNPGKKAYSEKAIKCARYLLGRQTGCTLCLSSCPWTKQNKTALHEIVRIMSSRLPMASKAMSDMDQAFGYGPTQDSQLIEDWWNLDLPAYGLDTADDRDRLQPKSRFRIIGADKMINLLLGLFFGIFFSRLASQKGAIPWYAWALYALAAGVTIFAFDVLRGSYQERQPAAGWKGFAMFGPAALFLFAVAWYLTTG